MDSIKLWLTENLTWIVISALIIAIIGMMIWRMRVPRLKGAAGLSLKTEVNIISAVTLVLIVVTLLIALHQQNIAAMIEIGVAVLVYTFFRLRIIYGGRWQSGAGGNKQVSAGGVKNFIIVRRKRLYLDKVFTSKREASEYVISMKKQHGDDHAFQVRPTKTAEQGVAWGIYTDLR